MSLTGLYVHVPVFSIHNKNVVFLKQHNLLTVQYDRGLNYRQGLWVTQVTYDGFYIVKPCLHVNVCVWMNAGWAVWGGADTKGLGQVE